MPSLHPEHVRPHSDPVSGARNLLVNCAHARRGERLLIVYEPDTYGYFDPRLRHEVSQYAQSLGLHVDMIDVGFDPSPAGLHDSVLTLISHVDIVVFLARLGDQLRFSDLPSGPRFVVCFALDTALLGSAFGTANYEAFCEIKAVVDAHILSSSHIVVTCPAGTLVTGRVPDSVTKAEDTTSARFPMSIFSPVLADEFSGRVVFGGFLTGTGSRYYDDYTIEFEGPIAARLENGRLAGFEGSADDVAKANAHYDRVAGLFNLDRNAVHSWHAGIHPGCGFPWDIADQYEKWGGTAFGNPRVLHFHTCGASPPGEISWNLFDPTISVDGVRVWENGTFHLERLPKGADILSRFPDVASVFANPDRNVGLGDVSPQRP